MPHTRLRPAYTLDQDRIDALKAIVPEAFADGRIVWDTLRDLLGDHIEDDDVEHFGLSWPGKREARRFAGVPSRGTLVPVPGEGVDEDNTRNIFIEGENLEVLKLLLKSYAGKVKMIYIDPPYNTGNDFIYSDNFTEPLEAYLRRTGQADDEGLLTSNPKSSGRYHSNWLSMMYPRLMVAQRLLTKDGAIFISIGEQEVHNLKQVISEVFGENNFVGSIVWQKSNRGDSKLVALSHEYVLVAVKDRESAIESGIWRRPKEGVTDVLAHYNRLRQLHRDDHAKISDEMRSWYRSLPNDDPRSNHSHYNWSDARGLYFADNFAGPDDGRKSRPRYDIFHPVTGKSCKKPSTGWRWSEERTQQALAEDPPLIHFGPDETTIPCLKTYLKETSTEPFTSVFYRDGRSATLEVEGLLGEGVMDFPKNVDVLRELIELIPEPNALILDFFAGSCSTAQAVLEHNRDNSENRRFIMIQIPEETARDSRAYAAGYQTASQIGSERIRRVIKRMHSDNNSSDQGLGFRFYRLDHSHYKQWTDYQGDDIQQIQTQFDTFETPLVDGWQPHDLLVEVMLIEGFPLDSSVTRQQAIAANDVRCVQSDFYEHRLWVCLDTRIQDTTIAALEIGSNDIFVCLDSALSDQSKVRLSDTVNLKTI